MFGACGNVALGHGGGGGGGVRWWCAVENGAVVANPNGVCVIFVLYIGYILGFVNFEFPFASMACLSHVPCCVSLDCPCSRSHIGGTKLAVGMRNDPQAVAADNSSTPVFIWRCGLLPQHCIVVRAKETLLVPIFPPSLSPLFNVVRDYVGVLPAFWWVVQNSALSTCCVNVSYWGVSFLF